jgi:prepilin-type N-terminal cleavage/methylation domain-containing protein
MKPAMSNYLGREPFDDRHRGTIVSREAEAGFSMIEMLVVILVITIIMGSVFKSINLAQQTSSSQQVRLDLTQQAREFMDQLTRDMHSSGYPNLRNMSSNETDTNVGNCPDGTTNLLKSPCDPTNGVGLIKIDVGTLWFAGDVDGTENYVGGVPQGTAQVKIIRYDLVPAGKNEPNCPCLRRTEYLRNAYQDPVADANATVANAQLEIQEVQNGTAADPIFTAYDPTTGLAVGLPIDFTNNANTVASINSLRVVLAVQSRLPDSNGAFPVTRVVSSIALNNCSEALGVSGLPLSC